MNLVLKLISSPWFWADVVLSVAGGLIVYWGLSVEKKAEKFMPPADFRPDIFEDVIKLQKSELERGWRILMTGIVVEVVAALGISIISGLEIADLTDQASIANDDAKKAVKEAVAAKLQIGQIGITNAQLSLQIEALRSNNLALELKLQPRIITPTQITNFIFLTEKIPKFPIRVSVGDANNETFQFALQIRGLLNKAGYEVPDSDKNSLNGIFPIPNGVLWDDIFTDKWTDIAILVKTNVSALVWFHSEKTNSFNRPTPKTNESGEIYAGIFSAFQQSGIETTAGFAPEWVGANEMSVFVRQRPH